MIVECPGCKLRYDVTGRPPDTRARCRCGTVFKLPDPANVAGSMSCPKCGGATTTNKRRCDYCGIRLALVRCPSCFTLMFEGAKHCRQCGTAIDKPARATHEDGTTALQCPRCQKPLVANLVSGTLIDQCVECGGVWLDHDVLERIVAEAEDREKVSTALGRMPAAPAAVDGRAVVYIKCPECETFMNRKNFARVSGVIVDICSAHGVWFDHEELARIIDFVRLGGMRKSRLIDEEETRRRIRNMKVNAPMGVSRQPQSHRGSIFETGLEGLVDILVDIFN